MVAGSPQPKVNSTESISVMITMPKDDGSPTVDGATVEELVQNLHNTSDDDAPGGTTREKFTCKCCGARVDAGKHKCSICQEAGCEFGEKKCKFH